MKNKKIKYCSELTVDKETGYILPEYAYSDLVMNSTKRYHNCIYLLARLNKCSRDLLDWLTEQMDDNNIIYSNSVVRQKFRDFVKEVTKEEISYADVTIKTAFKTLVNRDLLIPKQRGVYQVNPEYFFKGSEKDRISKVILKLEFSKGVDTKLTIEKHKNK